MTSDSDRSPNLAPAHPRDMHSQPLPEQAVLLLGAILLALRHTSVFRQLAQRRQYRRLELMVLVSFSHFAGQDPQSA